MRADIRGLHALAQAASCPVSFWPFAGAVIAGGAARIGAAWIARKALESDPEETRATAAELAGGAAFWLVGGLTWVALARRRS